MRITSYGHACFLIETGNHRLLTDPFLTGSPMAPITKDEVRCSYIFCSHAHDDHLGDTVAISRRNQATVVASYELSEYLSSQGLDTIDLMTGGGIALPFGHVRLTPAVHSAALELGEGRNLPLGIASGFLFSIEGKQIYFAGDTALFSDMRLLARNGLDLAFLPIGDRYTMGVEDAAAALEYLCPLVTVPMHYGTTKKLTGDPKDFVRLAEVAGHHVKVLEPGQSFDL